MTYFVCEDCGNHDCFEANITQMTKEWGLAYYEDGDSENRSEEWEDSEITEDDEDSVICSECDSYGVEEFDTINKRNLYLVEHTDLDGNWSVDELEPDKQNEELKSKYVADQL